MILSIQTVNHYLFLSTPSARRATPLIRFYVPDDKISIHALREEGDADIEVKGHTTKISIHALREEGDPVVD